MDLDHAKLAITELARYHALGTAFKTHKPEIFEKSRKLLTDFPFELSAKEFQEIVNHTINLISQDPRISSYADRIRATYEGKTTWQALLAVEAVEPWISINHGDFWVNNMMFRHGEQIDFQAGVFFFSKVIFIHVFYFFM